MFSIELKKLRESRGLSQYKLAQQLGVSQATVGMWESGKREPSFPVLRTLCEYFCVSADQFLGLPCTVSSQCIVESGVSDEDMEFLRKLRALSPVHRAAIETLVEQFYPVDTGEKRGDVSGTA